MRREDIKVTTPQHSVIYAIGGAALNNEKIWADPADAYWGNQSLYRPGYVLDVNRSGALVLTADFHPDSKQAKHAGQASLLDATEYSLADYEKRHETLLKFSHWAEDNLEGARKAALAELKEVPRGWRIDRMKGTYVRMLWAEYQAGLVQRAEFRAFRKTQEETAKKESKARYRAVVDRIRERVTLPKDTLERLLRSSDWSSNENIELPVPVLEELLAQLKTIRKAKGTTNDRHNRPNPAGTPLGGRPIPPSLGAR